MTIVRGNRTDPHSAEMKADLPENDQRQDEAQRHESPIFGLPSFILGPSSRVLLLRGKLNRRVFHCALSRHQT